MNIFLLVIIDSKCRIKSWWFNGHCACIIQKGLGSNPIIEF